MGSYRLYCVNSKIKFEWDWAGLEYETEEQAKMDAELNKAKMQEKHPDCYFTVRWVEEA